MIDGYVLAGGRSRRMGHDKARMAWNGRPMALAVCEILQQVCRSVALVRRGPRRDETWSSHDVGEVRVVWEPDDGDRHPLWGVATALADAQGARVMIAPCDVPFLSVTSVRRLLEADSAIIACDDGRRHPLIGVYMTSMLQGVREAARNGTSAVAFTSSWPALRLPDAELVNINTREQHQHLHSRATDAS